MQACPPEKAFLSLPAFLFGFILLSGKDRAYSGHLPMSSMEADICVRIVGTSSPSGKHGIPEI